jgi:peptidoglycan/xylan/chitin deacetylase (PgdA/CDA1 family)
LYDTDEYALFQSDLAVYHDDYGDYSTNEPTMDGTASLIYLLAAMEYESKLHQARPIANGKKSFTTMQGAVVRSDRTRRSVALVFTADEFADGLSHISQVLERQNIPASFFLTGRFLQQGGNADAVRNLISNEHYIGPHSDQHLLYCDWTKRDSLLVTRQAFTADLEENYRKLAHLGVSKKTARWFLPPYEWYNDSIAAWTADMGLQLVNFTAGTFSHADYTTPGMKNYRDSENIYHSITSYESSSEDGLNGFILLLHAGVSPERTDKFYHRLDDLINYLKKRGYTFSRINDLLQ